MVTGRKDAERQAFADRLNAALDEIGVPPKGKGRQTVVAKMFGLSQKGARKWLEAESFPDTARLPEIAAKVGRTTEYLLSGRGPKRSEDGAFSVRESTAPDYYAPRSGKVQPAYIRIPALNAEAAMGHGRAAPAYEEAVDAMTVSAAWLNRHVVASSAANLALITAYGDSMEGTFADGDVLLVDRGINEVKIDAVYVLALRDELYVKRLQRRPDGSILMISDNRKYEPYVIEDDRRDEFRVLGRVLLAWNAKKL